MSDVQQWLAVIGGAFSVIATIYAFVRWVVKPLRRGVAVLEGVSQILEAQVVPNGGSSLTDKVSAMHTAMFPTEGPRLPELVASIRADQLKRVSENDARHEENVARLDRLEAHHSETSHKLDRLEMRQELGARVIALMVPGIAPTAQEEVRRVIQEDPEVRKIIAEMQQPGSGGETTHGN